MINCHNQIGFNLDLCNLLWLKSLLCLNLGCFQRMHSIELVPFRGAFRLQTCASYAFIKCINVAIIWAKYGMALSIESMLILSDCYIS